MHFISYTEVIMSGQDCGHFLSLFWSPGVFQGTPGRRHLWPWPWTSVNHIFFCHI